MWSIWDARILTSSPPVVSRTVNWLLLIWASPGELVRSARVGLSIPSTDAEREMMGEASGNVLQKAADTAQDATQNVSEKAQQAMREATPQAGKQ